MVWFDERDLQRRAGSTGYDRGLGYVGAVHDLRRSSTEVTAAVRGTDEYRVRLSGARGSLTADCSCPWGQEGNFCKHCVAVGLAAIAAAPPDSGTASPAPPRPPAKAGPAKTRTAGSTPGDVADLRAHLAGLDHAALVDLLVGIAAEDAALHRLLSSRARPGEPDLAALGSAVDALRSTRGLDEAGVTRLGRAADEALRTLDLFAADHPAAVGPLYRKALEHLTAPDYDGHPHDRLSHIGDAVVRAIDGVSATSRAESPDPVALARWLIGVQLRNQRFPELTVSRFADVLGEEGLTSYWQQLSAPADADDDPDEDADEDPDEDWDEDWDDESYEDEDEDDSLPFRPAVIARLREAYLKDVAKDTDRLVAFYAEDLAEPRRYVRIGEALQEAGRFDEAVQWLQRGLTDARWGHTEICDLLVALCTRTGRLKEAARARLDVFSRAPDEYNYRMLLQAAEPLNGVAYAERKAMEILRERAARGHLGAADPLVKILVVIGDVDQAWAAAQQYSCSDDWMLNLARARAEDHPADAIPVFARQVDAAIARKDRAGYSQAARLLVTMKGFHERAGQDFDAYLTLVRSAHRRKSAFMERLAEVGL